MFIGHFAVALGAKRAAPRTSLGVLFAAAQLPDLLWPVFLLTGLERVRIAPGDTAYTPLEFTHYPWSHSLTMVVVWGLLLAIAYVAVTRDRRGAVAAGLLVVSHWVLDAITHRPDLPLIPGGDARVGLGLWNSVAGTLLVEMLLLAGGLLLYTRSTAARTRKGHLAFWSLVLLLLLIQASTVLGPPPPAEEPIAFAGLAMWLIVAWAWWADRNRASILRPTDAVDTTGR